MQVAGLHRFTLSDYPGKVASVVFTWGCTFRCPYCHNPNLVLGSPHDLLETEDIFAFLKSRYGQLDGLVVSGGEPTIQSRLPAFLAQVKALGYAVKLDTNGSRPEMLAQVVSGGLVDYVAMDVKGPLDRYETVAGVAIDGECIRRSVEVIRASGVEHEYRTTAVHPLLAPEDFDAIATVLGEGDTYVLQPYRGTTTLDASFAGRSRSYSTDELGAIAKRLSATGLTCTVRP